MLGTIDWNLFEDKFFRLEDGEFKRVELADWRSDAEYCFGDKEHARAALVFRVVGIDEKPVTNDKQWATTDIKLTNKFKPII